MHYEVKALRGSEGPTALMLDAPDAGDASAQAVARGYTVIAVKAKQSWQAWHQPRKAGFPLVLFSQELLALLDAGLALVESLETLAEKEQRPEIKAIMTQMLACLYEGHPLSYALAHSAANFPPLYVASVRASEKTGALPEALTRYIAYQSQMDGVRQQVISASIYPVLLAVVGGLVAMFLMLYVVPRFSHIYAGIGGDLPFMSRLLMHWGNFIGEHGGAFLGGAVVVLGTLGYAGTRPAFRQWLSSRLWQLPTIGAAPASLPAGAFLSFAGHAAARRHAGAQGPADGFRVAATCPARPAGAGSGKHPRRAGDFVFHGALRPHHAGGAAHAARG